MIRFFYKYILLVVFIFSLLPLHFVVAQEEPLNVYFFWGQGCPHCAKAEVFFDDTVVPQYSKQIEIQSFEIYNNKDNQDLFRLFALASGAQGVPSIFIGDKVISGYLSDTTTGQQIIDAIDECLANGCEDLGAQIISGSAASEPEEEVQEETSQDGSLIVDLPILGETDLSTFSLFGLTAVVAAIDGFNPCAMWVLLILIGFLLGMQNRRRMWLLGITFIVASAAVYFIFLAAWLEFFNFIGAVRPVQIAIGIAAVGVGVYYLNRFRTMKPGQCEVTNVEQRRKITERLKKIVRENALWIAIPSIIGLAFVVNLIELACSAGLPAIYTQVLSLSDLSRLEYYLFLLLYVVIFMLDDMLIFVIAMLTLKATGTTGKYSRYATLIGGAVIIIMGVLLIVRPDWLMFG